MLGRTLLQVAGVLCLEPIGAAAAEPPEPGAHLDPAAWGDDHVGKPLPGYVTGGECLFCHRDDVGSSWHREPHQGSVRMADPADPAVAAVAALLGDADLAVPEGLAVLGGDELVRFLAPNGRYGQFALLSAAWKPSSTTGDGRAEGAENAAGTGRLVREQSPRWDDDRYGARCAGCHSTAVATELRAFSAPSLDCFVCHGDVDPTHPEDGTRVLLAPGRSDPPERVTSICAQCHVRTGRSRSTGLPYPNQFVAGDNLFRDLEVDLSDEALARVARGDRHVLENVRAVVVEGKRDTTCLTCHRVHQPSTTAHRRLRIEGSCRTCHQQDGARWLTPAHQDRSELCEYGLDGTLAPAAPSE